MGLCTALDAQQCTTPESMAEAGSRWALVQLAVQAGGKPLRQAGGLPGRLWAIPGSTSHLEGGLGWCAAVQVQRQQAGCVSRHLQPRAASACATTSVHSWRQLEQGQAVGM